jgi:hypothetical protein
VNVVASAGNGRLPVDASPRREFGRDATFSFSGRVVT